jgi:hypothetical protein
MSAIFLALLKKEGLVPVTEHKFHPTRKWRFDYAFPDSMVAVEVEGGVWTGGRHTSGAGFIKDMEKYNTALLHGWRVYRVTPKTLTSRDTITDIVYLCSHKPIFAVPIEQLNADNA